MKNISSKKIAIDRIKILFKQAKDMIKENSKFADRYVFLAKKIAMRANVKFTSEQRKSFCKKCNSFLVPGVNCIVRTNSKTKCVEYTCKKCGNKIRHGYSKEKTKNSK